MAERTCERCRAVFIQRPRPSGKAGGKSRKYCYECARFRPQRLVAYDPTPCGHCRLVFIPKRAGTTFCSERCRHDARRGYAVAVPIPCEICAENFLPSRRGRTVCSNTCRNKRNRLQESPASAARRLADKKAKAPEYMRRYRATHPDLVRLQEADRRRRRWRSQPRVVEARKKIRRAARGSSWRWVWVNGPCVVCGEAFTERWNGAVEAMPAYCSPQCVKARCGRRRKISPATRLRVHERYEWVCQICGDPVDRSTAVPDLSAAVIDHIVPLALGGPHKEHNMQTAHFYCNSVKGARLEAA